MRRMRGGLWLAVLAAAACSRIPTGAPVGPESSHENPAGIVLLEALECTVIVSDGSFKCTTVDLSGESLRSDAIVGSQHRFVRLESSNLSYNAGTDILSADVTVQNMTLQPMATTDGTTPIAEGVRVFFHSGPTSGVDVANEDGVGTFTATNQPFFGYTGAQLGGAFFTPGILEQGEVSSSKSWQFDLNGATTFSFTVFVTAAVPDETRLTTALVQVDGGVGHTCGLDGQGQAYCWGVANGCVIGDGSCSMGRSTPRFVQQGGILFEAIAVGDVHSCGLTAGGQAYCWGENTEGQLGNGSNTAAPTPVAVSQPVGVTFATIDAGLATTCGLTAGGQAYCWGDDSGGQLGNAASGDSNVPVAVSQSVGVTFVAISPGDNHACAITGSGQAYCWGSDGEGQLGNGATTGTQQAPVAVTQPVGVTFQSIASGEEHTCGLTAAGQAYCWGDNFDGQVGDGAPPTDRDVATAVSQGGVQFSAIFTNGTARHTCALSGGQAYCWGLNNAAQIGDGTGQNSRPTPTAVTQDGISFTEMATSLLNTFAIETGQTRVWGICGDEEAGNGRVGCGQITTPTDPANSFVAATRNN